MWKNLILLTAALCLFLASNLTLCCRAELDGRVLDGFYSPETLQCAEAAARSAAADFAGLTIESAESATAPSARAYCRWTIPMPSAQAANSAKTISMAIVRLNNLTSFFMDFSSFFYFKAEAALNSS